MNESRRLPTMQNALESLLDSGVTVSCVLDVGILTGTAPLIRALPGVTHHLFEPVDLHFDQIERNYRKLDFKLHNVALSDKDGEVYLSCWSIHQDGRITHSQITEQAVTEAELPGLISCKTVRRVRLDSIAEREGIPDNCLLKIDVDGHELAVLEGATRTLQSTSVVVVEAPLNRIELPAFFERSQFLMNRGFYLMDIVDLAYYDGILWQADLVFVRKSIVDAIDRLRPFESSSFVFSGDKWFPSGDRLFRGL